jgi:hypothetical protein
MRNGYRLRLLLLLAGLGAMTGCAPAPDVIPFPSTRPDPRVIAQTGALEGDWARIARASETSPSRTVAGAPADRHLVHPTAAHESGHQHVADSAADAPADPPRRKNLWDKQPWEIELDKTVRGICRGC